MLFLSIDLALGNVCSLPKVLGKDPDPPPVPPNISSPLG